jgi:hypothetical protein
VYNINRKAAAAKFAPSLLKLLNYADSHGFLLRATYIVGEHNDAADRLSRLERAGDYQLNPEIFGDICDRLHFYPKVDLFASKQNHLLPTWGGLRAPIKENEAAKFVGNAFNTSWKDMKPLIHPPIPLIFKSLKKFQREATGRAMFIAPDWQGQYWSPLLKELTDRKFVIGPITEDLLIPGSRMKKRMKDNKGTLLPPGNLAVYILRVKKHSRQFIVNQQGDCRIINPEPHSIVDLRVKEEGPLLSTPTGW